MASLFHSANLSVCPMGYCVPFHTKQLFEDLGVGLGIKSMQGRESKHQQLASFASFDLMKHRWAKVFRHEHMSNIWIRQQNPFHDTYKKCKDTYVPKRCSTSGYCSCGMPLSPAGACMYCSCKISTEIIACALSRKNNSKDEKKFGWSSKMKNSLKLSWIPSDQGCAKVGARESNIEIIRGLPEESSLIL